MNRAVERLLPSVLRMSVYARSALFAVSLCTGLPAISRGAEPLSEGGEFVRGKCFARFSGTELVIGNSHVQRKWRVDHGRLFATSFFDVDRQIEWLHAPSNLPSPSPPVEIGDGHAVMRGGSGIYGPTEKASLRVELEDVTSDAEIDYEFQVFPDASGIRMWLVVKDGRTAGNPGSTTDGQASASEVPDALEHLRISMPHLSFTQVIMRDQTDQHNELVFENEWLLQPSEVLEELKGNVFVVENTISGDGLIFLKEAPEPEARPVKSPLDARFSGSAMSVSKRNPVSDNFYGISFYGNGFSTRGRGYPCALMAFHGGRNGRIAAIQQYQRQIRQYVPGRDGQLISNTWGDRSLGQNLSEGFIQNEIDAGQALGVDIIQVDDGWQQGNSINTVSSGGVWEGFRNQDPHFWDPERTRLPEGLRPLSSYAASHGMKLGLWFAPDSYHDFADWRKDANQLLAWNRDDGVAAFKLDSVKIRSKEGEANYQDLTDTVLRESSGRILLDLDVTAERRQGYFGNIAAGPLFVENRYTDTHRYWPHQTLRNLWKLSQYVDPIRLRMEFLNSARNTSLYENDPLAPAHYRPSCLFAITMFASPLAWFENTGLSPGYVRDVSPLIQQWKKERESIYRGTILPIGNVPDGLAWTGFASVAEGGNDGYLLVFRELNQQSSWVAPRSLFAAGNHRIQVLGGMGTVIETKDGFEVTIPEQLGFLWAKLSAVN